MSHDTPLSTQPSSPAASASTSPSDDTSQTVRLFTAEKHITLHFAQELASLAAEIRELWAHVLDDEDATHTALDLRFTTDSSIAGTVAHEPVPGGILPYPLHPDDPSNAFLVSGRVTTALIREMVGEHILLHAGAVERQDLGTVLVVGPSGAGKSTSTVALGQDGTYLTDELTIIDPEDFHVTGYPKPVSRVVECDDERSERSTARGRDKNDIAPGALTLRPGVHGTAPSHVLLLDRQSLDEDAAGGGSSATPSVTAERTPTVEALHTLAAQSSSTWLVEGGLARLMLLLDRCGGALTVRYREANDLAQQLPDLVTKPAHRAEWRHVPGRDSTGASPGTYATTTFSDAVALAGSIVVLRKGALVSMQGLGALVWDILDMSGPLTRDALLAETIDALGENSHAGELMDGALKSLLDDQLIICGGAAEE